MPNPPVRVKRNVSARFTYRREPIPADPDAGNSRSVVGIEKIALPNCRDRRVYAPSPVSSTLAQNVTTF